MEEETMNIFPFEKEMDNSSILYMLEKWITTPELKTLVQSFGGNIQTEGTIVEQIHRLIKFSDIWNFRKKQSAADIKTAKWAIVNEGLSSEQEELTLAAARKLGLIGCTTPSHKKYDYIIVLGGAGMSCLFQMKYAKEICDKYDISTPNIVGLAGMRGIMESERSATDTYAPNAKTEFDLMKAALWKVFGSLGLKKEENMSETTNKLCVTECYVGNVSVTLLAAPSGELERHRTNTADTFAFFMKQLEVGCGINLLLVTSQIYVPYQQLEAIRILGIPYNHSIETIGFPSEWSAGLQGLQKTENYLQEIRSVLQSIGRLLDELK